MKIFKKILNSYKVKRIIKNLTEYKFFIEDMFFYFFSLFFTFNEKAELTIITAADNQFFESLVQLIQSIRAHEPDAKIIVYDIGLDDLQIEKLKQFNLYQFKKFNFKKYPKFFSERDEFGKLGEYAWKSAMVHEVIENENNDIVMWFDAGNVITAPLQKLKKVISFNKFYSPLSTGNLSKWCHEKTLSYFNVPQNLFNKPNLTGGVVGFDSTSTKAKNLASNWFKYSMVQECIAPEGSHRNNHRQDQSVLSILFYLSSELNYTPKTKNFFSIKVNQNPGSKVYLLDANENSDFKIEWLKKQDSITTNTVSNANAIWILNMSEINKLERKYFKDKKIIFNVSTKEDIKRLISSSKVLKSNMENYYIISKFDFDINILVNKGFVYKNIINLNNQTHTDKFKETITNILNF